MDIEGTITPKPYVYETLFPYFLSHLGKIEDKQNELEYCNALKEVKETMRAEGFENIEMEDILEVLQKWVEDNRKHPALKKLQGLIWESGYRKGSLKGEVYEDVPPALKRWSEKGIKLGVFSSGSIQSQKLLFGFSEHGNLCTYFDAFFDTQVGHKREEKSYLNILNELELTPSDVLFISDTPDELDVAKAVGIRTVQIVRPETEAGLKHDCVASFSEIIPDTREGN